jgi:hypothetical protein
MAINFNNQNRGIGTLDLSQFGLMQPQNTNMQVAGAYDTPTEGEYGFNLIQLDRLKNAGYDPAELSTYPNQEDVQSIIRNLEPTANANNIMTDASASSPSSIYNNNGQYGLFSLQDTPENVLNSGYGETYYGKSRAFDQANRNQALRDVENGRPTDFAEGYGAGTDRIDYDPAFGTLSSVRRFQPAPYTGQRPFANMVDLPSNSQQFYNMPPSLERILDRNTSYNRFELSSETPQTDSISELTSQPQELGFIESAPQPKEAIYQDRIMNNNLPSYGYEPKQGIMQNLRNKIGSGFNNVKDFVIDKGNKGRNLIGSAGAMAMGLPGMVGSGVMSLLSGLGNGADYQKYTPGFNYNGLNDSMINDFFDPATGLNRFDRARKKGNTFASARTGAEYFKARREKKAAAEAAAQAAAERASYMARAQRTADSRDSGQGNTVTGFGKSGLGRDPNDRMADGGRVGLASMFTRKR